MFLYNQIIHGYTAAVSAAARFNPKARLWVEGRKGLTERIAEAFEGVTQPVVWVHCASLGEFEQGRPVIEAIRSRYPEYKILLTFFSPSGYEVRKNYTSADWVFYLPSDTPANAYAFVNAVSPITAIFVKYEFWFNYITELHGRGIPIVVISAIFRARHPFFRWYGLWFRRKLQMVSRFYVQNESSGAVLRRARLLQVMVSGDTRFDRVKSVASQPFSHPVVEAFAAGSKVLVAGSTWPPDETLLLSLMTKMQNKLKLLIAPHEVDEPRVAQLVSDFGEKTVRLSEATQQQAAEARVLVVDSVGMLSQLYRFGQFAYIGGGFGVGTHNILEAAVFGLPLFFGPNHQKFRETVDLVRLRGAFPVNSSKCLITVFTKVSTDDYLYHQAHSACLDYIERNLGATDVIMRGLKRFLTPR